MMPMPQTILDRVENLTEIYDLTAYYCDAFDILDLIGDNSVVYIDPPYKGTQTYEYDFDYIEFINRCKAKHIYLSECCKYDKSLESICLSSGRNKGNINGKKTKTSIEEWLNIVR